MGFAEHNIRNAGRRAKRALKKYETMIEETKDSGQAQLVAKAFRLGIRFAAATIKSETPRTQKHLSNHSM